MIDLLLYVGQDKNYLDVLLWVILPLLALLAILLIVIQHRNSAELEEDLSLLDNVKKNTVEYEFVLKAMKISTWHIDTATMTVTYDNDFRAKDDSWVPISDGTLLKDCNKLLVDDDIPRVAKALDDICKGRTETYHEQYRVRVGNTSNFYWEESFATIAERDVDGMPVKVVGASVRIDERKDLEQTLVEARNKAEESDRLKSAFIANMSHEIRTPLNAIVGFTSVMPDVDDSAEQQTIIDLIHENTRRLLRIVDDVVMISKIEAGQVEMTLSTFDLNVLLQDEMARYGPKVTGGVELTSQFALQSQMITTDYARLKEVMSHLLANAVKFTSRGSIVVGYDAPSETHIKIWVRDTGKGVRKENLENIFERFFKEDEFVPGAGLGLSTCRIMAYSMGGRVSCQSEVGKGSTFILELPIQ